MSIKEKFEITFDDPANNGVVTVEVENEGLKTFYDQGNVAFANLNHILFDEIFKRDNKKGIIPYANFESMVTWKILDK